MRLLGLDQQVRLLCESNYHLWSTINSLALGLSSKVTYNTSELADLRHVIIILLLGLELLV
jgi:hypothetical protein